jgi:hypothetical protein
MEQHPLVFHQPEDLGLHRVLTTGPDQLQQYRTSLNRLMAVLDQELRPPDMAATPNVLFHLRLYLQALGQCLVSQY